MIYIDHKLRYQIQFSQMPLTALFSKNFLGEQSILVERLAV